MQPKPWIHLSWQLCPGFISDGAAFAALPSAVQAEVFRHWIWSRRNGQLHGHGLVQHYNWLRWCEAEDAADDFIPGLSVGGVPQRRADWP